jgi:hypothetical protein
MFFSSFHFKEIEEEMCESSCADDEAEEADHDLNTFKCLPEVTRSARPLTQPYKVYDTTKKNV